MNEVTDTPFERDRKQALENARQTLTFARRRQQELTAFQQQEPLTALQSDDFFQTLQKGFFNSLLPLPSTITSVLSVFYHAMSKDQRKELCDIGTTFATLPFDWFSGKKTPEDCYKTCVSGINKLEHFFTEVPDILINTASSFLNSVLPLGNFLGTAIQNVLESGLSDQYKQPMMRGLNGTLNALDGLVNTIERGPSFSEKRSQ
jgi:hypothetical protein